MWRLIRSLNGTPEKNSPNEAMKQKEKTITSDEKKVEIFAKHFASISRHHFTKGERELNRECKKKLRITRNMGMGPVNPSRTKTYHKVDETQKCRITSSFLK